MSRLLNFNENGFYIFGEDIYDVPEDTIPEENQYLATDDEVITFVKPKLVNGQIVEGKTEDEFLEDEYLQSLIPSKEESDKAEFEIKVLTLLEEMGML